MIEHFFQCPYCWEQISFLLDTSIQSNTSIEDCEVCCNPIQFSAAFSNRELQHFSAINIEQ
ncbi:CPXCG motif-containing cysteine-rich protein [Urechidicola vernalis]|uniref:CPXCG motif-containing cysteine-rich protein n=1 Tax=Urechidicola vernalis TaxID=3075600 RepID=A0ABU2Y145_9FLAO|nr:CPXCG motif-containing cysteine-rich protein [Urechidicola sp. P050]MDT0551914.1 CPXCG motif-containing cysteine-rich protein [Urechidicola sp. P050]